MKNVFNSLLLILLYTLNPFTSHSQVINWATETGLAAGSTLVDGQVISNFGGSGLSVTLNVNVVGVSPFIDSSDPTKINIGSADGCAVTISVNGGTLDVLLENNINLLTGEVITLSNVDSKNITIQETASNGGARMTVDGTPMTGTLPSTIVEDDIALMTEQDNGAGTQWNASMEGITSFTWLYNFGTGPTGNEGFSLTILDILVPVEFISLSAENVDQSVQVNWQTASEINNDYYIVEKSADALSWESVESIKGNPESSQIHSYRIIDSNPIIGLSYYRIKQVDLDGKYSYSNIVNAKTNNASYDQVKIYPNPTTNEITIEANENDLEFIHLYNMLGQDLSNLVLRTKQSKTKQCLDLQALDNACYFLKINGYTKLVYKNE